MSKLAHEAKVFKTHNPISPQPDPYWEGICTCGATWITIGPVGQCPNQALTPAPSHTSGPRKVITQPDIDRIDAEEGPNRAVVKGRSNRFGDSHD